MKTSKKRIFSFILLLSFSALFFIFSGPIPEIQAQSRMNETELYRNQIGISEVRSVYGDKQPEDIRIVATKIIQWILGFLALIFLVLIIFAGFQWMTSGGNEEGIKKAQSLMKNAVIGLIIILAAWSLSYYLLFVFRRIIIDQAVDFTHVP